MATQSYSPQSSEQIPACAASSRLRTDPAGCPGFSGASTEGANDLSGRRAGRNDQAALTESHKRRETGFAVRPGRAAAWGRRCRRSPARGCRSRSPGRKGSARPRGAPGRARTARAVPAGAPAAARARQRFPPRPGRLHAAPVRPGQVTSLTSSRPRITTCSTRAATRRFCAAIRPQS